MLGYLSHGRDVQPISPQAIHPRASAHHDSFTAVTTYDVASLDMPKRPRWRVPGLRSTWTEVSFSANAHEEHADQAGQVMEIRKSSKGVQF